MKSPGEKNLLEVLGGRAVSEGAENAGRDLRVSKGQSQRKQTTHLRVKLEWPSVREKAEVESVVWNGE